MRCSVGLASNRLLAKVASDMETRRIDRHHLEYRNGYTAWTCPTCPASGFEWRPSTRHRYGGAALRSFQERLRSIWQSVLGRQWWHWLRGHDLPDQPTHRRTVGHSHVLPRNCETVRMHDGSHSSDPPCSRQTATSTLLGGHDGLCCVSAKAYRPWVVPGYRVDGQPSATSGSMPSGTPLQVGVTLFNLVADESATLPLFTEKGP